VPVIEYVGVHKAYGRPVLRGVDLQVEAGETLAVVGRSGVGKSVLLRLTVGLAAPDTGEIRVAGQSVPRATPREMAAIRRRIGYVFQGGALFDSMTVGDNIAYGLPDDVLAGLTPGELARRIAATLDRVHLAQDISGRLPAELSGGMRKRVALARALIARPRILLFDEPVTGLDPVTEAAIHALIREVSAEAGVTAILVTHHVDGALRIADRVALLEEGVIRFTGPPDGFRHSDDPLIRGFLDPDAAAGLALTLEGTGR
jgi:phospholipid/cholesterol/gamma-HCH transport system ATP-binding protein